MPYFSAPLDLGERSSWSYQNAAPRFWLKVRVNPGRCWNWIGSTNQQGYGQMTVRQGFRWVTAGASRVSYALIVGPIPRDMTIDHLCYNPNCVNPEHLEVVSFEENLARRRPRQNAPGGEVSGYPPASSQYGDQVVAAAPHPSVVISLKGSRADDPWFVVHAVDSDHAKELLGSSFKEADTVFRDGGDLVRGLLAAQYEYRSRTEKAAMYYAERSLNEAGAVQQEVPAEPEQQAYQSRYDNQPQQGYQQASPQQNAPQQRSYGPGAAAPSNAKHCKHGEMVYREGISKKNNRPYKAFFCPSPQGTPDACSAEFVR